MINHKPEIDVNGEALNGSSINVDMKTSIFELMKAGILDYLKKETDIKKVELLTTSKAYSKNGEEADVEYHVDVSFVINDVTEKVKMKCLQQAIEFRFKVTESTIERCILAMSLPQTSL